MNTLSGGNRTDKADGGKAENGFFAKHGIRKAGKSQGCSFSLKLTFRMIFRMPLSFAPPKERGERKGGGRGKKTLGTGTLVFPP